MGWVVAAVVIIAAGVFYFWPQVMKAPSTAQNTEQASTQTQPTAQPDMPGTWRSDKDAKFTREIRADGVIIDHYEGEPTAGVNGQWSAVADVSAEAGLTIPAAALAGKTVIKVVWEGGAETTYFAIDSLTGSAMTTTDLSGRGEVNTWTRL